MTEWTVMTVLSASTDHLRKHGSASPRLDAELLLARVLGVTRLRLYLMHDMPMETAQRDVHREFIRRRAKGEPVAYLLGEREFHGHTFSVDRRVLVPRPETEFLVDAGVEAIDRLLAARPFDTLTVLDLCTGSGCVALSVKLARPQVSVTAVDVSRDALVVARENEEALSAAGGVEWIEGDLDRAVVGRTFDIVLSNPPYVTDLEFDELPVDVRQHEPEVALRSGTDALSFHRRILAACRDGLWRPGGRIALEMGNPAGAIDMAALTLPLGRIDVRRDYAGCARVLVVDS